MLLWISIFSLYLFSIIISGATSIHIIIHKQNYGTKFYTVLNLTLIVISGIVYTSFFTCSILFYFSDEINVFLWKTALISGVLNFFLILIQNCFIYKYKYLPVIPFLIYVILAGLLIGFLFSPDSIQIITSPNLEAQGGLNLQLSDLNYIFDLPTILTASILQVGSLAFLHILSILIFRNARNKNISSNFLFGIFFFSIPIAFYVLYMILQWTIFRELHFVTLILNLIPICFMMFQRSEIFLALTHRIYAINIYHKSGVLLYSYDFGKAKEDTNSTSSTLWGNILIGINHILSEFINKEEQIDMIQTNEDQILVDYNDQYGIAVLVITNQKNEFLDNLTSRLMTALIKQYGDELNELLDLNRMIDVMEFEETKRIIEEIFKNYI